MNFAMLWLLNTVNAERIVWQKDLVYEHKIVISAFENFVLLLLGHKKHV